MSVGVEVAKNNKREKNSIYAIWYDINFSTDSTEYEIVETHKKLGLNSLAINLKLRS